MEIKICNEKITVQKVMGEITRFSSNNFCFYVSKEDEKKLLNLLQNDRY